MNNYNKALDYTNIATNSAGTAMQKFQNYEDGIEAATKRLQATWEGFINNTFKADSFKIVIDTGTDLVTIFDTLINKSKGFLPILALVTTAWIALTLAQKNNILASERNIIADTALALKESALAVATGELGTAFEILNKSALAVTLVIAAVSGAIYGLIKLNDVINPSFDQQSKKLETLKEDYDNLQSTLTDLQSQQQQVIDQLKQLDEIRTKSGLTAAQKEQYQNLVDTNTQLKDQIAYQKTLIDIKNADLQKQAVKTLSSNTETFIDKVSDAFASDKDVLSQDKSSLSPIERLIANTTEINNLTDSLKSLNGELDKGTISQKDWKDQSDYIKDSINNLIKDNANYVDKVKEASSNITDEAGANYDLKKSADSAVDGAIKAANSYDNLGKAVDNTTNKVVTNTAATNDNTEQQVSLSDLINSSLDAYESLNNAIYKVTNGYALSESEIKALLKAYPDLIGSVSAIKDGYTIEESALKSLWNTQVSQAKAQAQAQLDDATATIKAVKARIQAYEQEIKVLQSLGGIRGKTGVLADMQVLSDADQANDLKTELKQAEDAQKTAQAALDFIDNLTSGIGTSMDKGTSPKSSGSQKTEIEKLDEAFQKLIKTEENQIKILSYQKGTEQQQIAIYKQMQDQIHAQAEKYRAMGLAENSEYIQNLQIQYQEYGADIEKINKDIADAQAQANKDALDKLKTAFDQYKDSLNKQIKSLQDQEQAVNDTWQSKIDAYKAEHDQLEKTNTLLDLQNKLIEAQQELSNTANEKTVKMLHGTQWEWVSNPNTLKQLQDAVTEAQNNYNKEVDQQNFDNSVAQMEASQKAATQVYEDQIKILQNQLDGLDDQLQTYENMVEGSVGNLVDTFNELQQAISNFTNQLNGGNSSSSGLDYSILNDATAAGLMQKNSTKYSNSTSKEREELHDQNINLAAGRGWTYDSSTGKWLDSKGIPIYHSGTAGAGGTTLMPGQNELFALLKKGEPVISADMIPNLMKLVSLGSLTSGLIRNTQNTTSSSATHIGNINVNTSNSGLSKILDDAIRLSQ